MSVDAPVRANSHEHVERHRHHHRGDPQNHVGQRQGRSRKPLYNNTATAPIMKTPEGTAGSSINHLPQPPPRANPPLPANIHPQHLQQPSSWNGLTMANGYHQLGAVKTYPVSSSGRQSVPNVPTYHHAMVATVQSHPPASSSTLDRLGAVTNGGQSIPLPLPSQIPPHWQQHSQSPFIASITAPSKRQVVIAPSTQQQGSFHQANSAATGHLANHQSASAVIGGVPIVHRPYSPHSSSSSTVVTGPVGVNFPSSSGAAAAAGGNSSSLSPAPASLSANPPVAPPRNPITATRGQRINPGDLSLSSLKTNHDYSSTSIEAEQSEDHLSSCTNNELEALLDAFSTPSAYYSFNSLSASLGALLTQRRPNTVLGEPITDRRSAPAPPQRHDSNARGSGLKTASNGPPFDTSTGLSQRVEGAANDMARSTTSEWKNNFSTVKERFNGGNNSGGVMPTNSSGLNTMLTFSPNGSQTIPRSATASNGKFRDEDGFYPLHPPEFERLSSPVRRDLGQFWMASVKSSEQSASDHAQLHRLPLGLTAAQRLEQLHESIDGIRGGEERRAGRGESLVMYPPTTAPAYPYRKSNVESVAARRTQYLRETFRSQSPFNGPAMLNGDGASGRITPMQRTPSTELPGIANPDFAPLESAIDEIRVETTGHLHSVVHSLPLVNNRKQESKGCAKFPTGGDPTGHNRHLLAPHSLQLPAQPQHSPSPDTLSETSSQQSLSFLPHPRPKHNIREQLMQAGFHTSLGHWMAGYNNQHGRQGAPPPRSSSPNFPSPTSNSVAMRICALERMPSAPAHLQLAGEPHLRMAPKSTVYRTKSIIHAESTATEGEGERRKGAMKSDGGQYSPRWRGDDFNEAAAMAQKTQQLSLLSTDAQRRQQNSVGNGVYPLGASINAGRITTHQFRVGLKSVDAANAVRKEEEGSLHASPTTTAIVQPSTSVNNEPSLSIYSNGTKAVLHNHVPPSPTTTIASKAPAAQRLHRQPPTYHHAPLPQTTRQTGVSIAGRLANMPRFHFPAGRPVSREENDTLRDKASELFNSQHPQGALRLRDFDELCRRLHMPVYTKQAVFNACCRLNGLPVPPIIAPEESSEQSQHPLLITYSQFLTYWNRMVTSSHDEASRFIFTLVSARAEDSPPALLNNGLLPHRLQQQQRLQQRAASVTKEDFVPILMDLIHTHPGLHFLRDAPQFHSKYCEVVIVRIFWDVNRSWSGRIMAEELRKSNFLQALHSLEEVTDINKVTDYFSYEHFYVTYCKFWELDTDHDMVISRDDMRRHCNGALTDRIIDRIFSAAVVRTPPEQRVNCLPGGPVRQTPIETIGFEDFVAFLLAEEDKRHPTSIEYWFRCVDLDGDGRISLYEMEYFYGEVEQKLQAKNMETLNLKDVICNLLDSVSPAAADGDYVTRADLRRCGLAHRFFNTFVNYLKYLEQESSEGERASVKTVGDKDMSDWETFCAMEYELLMGEADAGDGYPEDSIDVVLDDEGNDSEEFDPFEQHSPPGSNGSSVGQQPVAGGSSNGITVPS